MSMLAGRKVKQRWSLNPRGTAWSEDSNKFGQKMLEKMGWSKGKGLGAKEDGVVEHVKLSYKNDSKGMGYKDMNNQWTEHNSNFEALLQSLSSERSEEHKEIRSLEEKSQSSKVRVHYKKFTRGKDLSRCSERDLANIFGKKSLKKENLQKSVTEESPESATSFMYNGGSMLDYFRKKLGNSEQNGTYVVGGNGVLTTPKKRKAEDSDLTPKKKKSESDLTPPGLSNPAFDPLFHNVKVEKHCLNTIVEEEDTVSNSHSKKRTKKSLSKLDKKSFDNEEAKNNVIEVKRRKKSDSSLTSQVSGFVNENFDLQLEESCDNNTFEVKRKKKKKKSSFSDSTPSVSDSFDNQVVGNGDNTFEVKRKKKKNNTSLSDSQVVNDSQHSMSGVVNQNFDTQVEDNFDNNAFEVRRKKHKDTDSSYEVKKKKKLDAQVEGNCDNTFEVMRKNDSKHSVSGVANLNFDNKVEDKHDNNAFEVRRKKKSSLSGVTNENFAVQEFDEPILDLMLNVVVKPVSKTPRKKTVRFSNVNEERIIPTEANEIFDINSEILDNVEEMSKKIDGCQAEVENDMNEAKVTEFGTRLMFRDANFKSGRYTNRSASRSKASYKHLIKGDVLLTFNNTNLHEVVGYGVSVKKRK